jgi:hypothetical protein
MESKTIISCPSCGHSFSPESAIESTLRDKLDKEFATKIQSETEAMRVKLKNETAQEFNNKLAAVEKQAQEKSQKLLELQRKEVEWEEASKRLKEKEEEMEITIKRKMLEQESTIRAEADKRANEKALIEFQEREAKLRRERENLEVQLNNQNRQALDKMKDESEMKSRELQKKLDDQAQLINEMKRKAEQGSMQLQGEVQEIAIEEYLKRTFPFDEISEVGKGVNGADCIHVVKTAHGTPCGKIIYESKRTKHFGGEWPDKLKADMRAAGCDIAILVTEVYPKELTRFGLYEGVWVCSFAEMKSLSMIVRQGLVRVGDAIASQENKGDKMQMLYDYLTGTEFRNYVEIAVESLATMKSDLEREKKSFYKNWAERDKQIDKLVVSTLNMFGSVKGIAGSSFQDIPQLQLLENGEAS